MHKADGLLALMEFTFKSIGKSRQLTSEYRKYKIIRITVQAGKGSFGNLRVRK